MEIAKLLTGSPKVEDMKFKLIPDSKSLNFVLPHDLFVGCKKASDSISPLVLKQFIALQMLAEQGAANEIADGFCILNNDAVCLDRETRTILELPQAWPGIFDVRFKHLTSQSSFCLELQLKTLQHNTIIHYELEGPLLRLTDTETYLPTPEQWQVLKSVSDHQRLTPEERDEFQNLMAVHQLKLAEKAGCKIELHHFDQFQTEVPEHITVTGRILESGDMLLSPQFDDIAEPERIETRLNQLDKKGQVQSLRVDDTLILLDETKLKAVHEIISNRRIPKKQIQSFFKTPTAFLDANLVDLDLGFSLRIRGATTFKHAYFGETDISGISWFENALKNKSSVKPIQTLSKIISDNETLKEIEIRIEDAKKTGATVIEIEGLNFDITDALQTRETIKSIQKKLNHKEPDAIDAEANDEKTDASDDTGPDDTIVVDVIENDEVVEYGKEEIVRLISDVLYKKPLDFSVYKRPPYPHQKEGIRWILGLSGKTLEEKKELDSTAGALLADDMGLGKTYMALVAVSEYYNMCREKGILERPVLIVAPLSVLENWQDEVSKTFKHMPFRDIIILQTAADLKKFKQQGSGIEIRQKSNATLLKNATDSNTYDPTQNAIRYSLKIGKSFGLEKLDRDKRLVITTYQTLRDYQFSMCRIDWSFVIFDEAQNIKNPNALITRAAKGLRAQFKLLATGTPVENHLGDFWCLMDTAAPGTLGAYQAFRKEYITPIRQAEPSELSQIRLDVGRKLRKKVGALMLRRLKEDNIDGLPKKVFHIGLDVDNHNYKYDPSLDKIMEGEQLQRYNTIIDVVLESKEQGTGKNQVLSGLYQLREISLHPLLLNQGTIAINKTAQKTRNDFNLSGKLHSLLSVLDTKKKLEEKTIIFLINKRLQSYLKMALSRIYSLNVNIINGDTKAVAKSKRGANETRKALIHDFESQPGFGIIIMSPIAAGTGLTVVSANNVIHLERHWNPAKEDQATDRVYRIGQKKDVNVYLPILKHPQVNSFDVNLHSLLSKKIVLKDAVVSPEEVNTEDMYRSNFKNFTGMAYTDNILDGKGLDLLSWQELEALCAEIYQQYYDGSAQLTPNNDHGADVVIFGKKNVLIQCKQTSKKQYNSSEPLVGVHAAKPFYEEKLGKKFDVLISATNARSYSKRIKKEAKIYSVELVSFKELEKLLGLFPVTRRQIQRRLAEPKLFE